MTFLSSDIWQQLAFVGVVAIVEADQPMASLSSVLWKYLAVPVLVACVQAYECFFSTTGPSPLPVTPREVFMTPGEKIRSMERRLKAKRLATAKTYLCKMLGVGMNDEPSISAIMEKEIQNQNFVIMDEPDRKITNNILNKKEYRGEYYEDRVELACVIVFTNPGLIHKYKEQQPTLAGLSDMTIATILVQSILNHYWYFKCRCPYSTKPKVWVAKEMRDFPCAPDAFLWGMGRELHDEAAKENLFLKRCLTPRA